MRKILKFFAGLLFSAMSLHGYIVENHTQFEINIYAFYKDSNSQANSIPFENALITWISKFRNDYIFSTNSHCLVTLQPGQMVDVTMDENKGPYCISIYYIKEIYTSTGQIELINETRENILAGDKFIFKQETKIVQKFDR